MPLHPNDLGQLLSAVGPDDLPHGGTYAYATLEIGRAAQLNLQVLPDLDNATAITGLEIGFEVSNDNTNWAEIRLRRVDTDTEALAHQLPAADKGKTLLFTTEQARGSRYSRIRYRAYGGAGPVKEGDTLIITGDWW